MTSIVTGVWRGYLLGPFPTRVDIYIGKLFRISMVLIFVTKCCKLLNHNNLYYCIVLHKCGHVKNFLIRRLALVVSIVSTAVTRTLNRETHPRPDDGSPMVWPIRKSQWLTQTWSVVSKVTVSGRPSTRDWNLLLL